MLYVNTVNLTPLLLTRRVPEMIRPPVLPDVFRHALPGDFAEAGKEGIFLVAAAAAVA